MDFESTASARFRHPGLAEADLTAERGQTLPICSIAMGKRRLSKQIFSVNDRLVHLDEEETRVSAELGYHSHLADDAVRDAAVYESSFHRDEADRALADVDRFERALEEIDHRRGRLLAKRDRLMERMDSFGELF